jgi:hypothetical protein
MAHCAASVTIRPRRNRTLADHLRKTSRPRGGLVKKVGMGKLILNTDRELSLRLLWLTPRSVSAPHLGQMSHAHLSARWFSLTA